MKIGVIEIIPIIDGSDIDLPQNLREEIDKLWENYDKPNDSYVKIYLDWMEEGEYPILESIMVENNLKSIMVINSW